MNKKNIAKYLDLVSEDALSDAEHMRRYHPNGIKPGSSCSRIGKKPSYSQTEFSFESIPNNEETNRQREDFLKRYEEWIKKIRDTSVIANELKKYDGKDPEVEALIAKAIKRVTDANFERYMDGLGERA